MGLFPPFGNQKRPKTPKVPLSMVEDKRSARVEMNMDEIRARILPQRSTGIAPTTTNQTMVHVRSR